MLGSTTIAHQTATSIYLDNSICSGTHAGRPQQAPAVLYSKRQRLWPRQSPDPGAGLDKSHLVINQEISTGLWGGHFRTDFPALPEARTRTRQSADRDQTAVRGSVVEWTLDRLVGCAGTVAVTACRFAPYCYNTPFLRTYGTPVASRLNAET